MKTLLRWLAVSLVTAFAATSSLAQQRFSQAELDQALAPVALYPDSMLSQLLMAATYPRDVAEAALWSRSNPRLIGEEAVRRIENEPWDPSVKSLVAFPQVLAMMGERPDWVQRLGGMFANAPEQVADTVQELRRRADDAGNLRSGDEMKVYRDDRYYYIEPASPEVVYVPYYDPRVVYGRWWWPSYQPIWWRPWVGYSWTPGYAGFGWGYGISLGSGFFYSSFDWPSRYIFFRDTWPRYYRGWDNRGGHRWWHDRAGDRRNWSGNHDGRWDGRRRDGDRDGRWDGRRRDGERDRDRDGRPDAPRDTNRDRNRDGRPDGDRARDRDHRGAVDNAPLSPVYRNARTEPPHFAPRVNGAVAGGRGYGHAAPEQPVVAVPAANPAARSAPQLAPAAPVANPVGRSAPAQAPAPARESRSEDRPGGGRGSGERARPQ